jgi:hypothetical protein
MDNARGAINKFEKGQKSKKSKTTAKVSYIRIVGLHELIPGWEDPV